MHFLQCTNSYHNKSELTMSNNHSSQRHCEAMLPSKLNPHAEAFRPTAFHRGHRSTNFCRQVETGTSPVFWCSSRLNPHAQEFRPGHYWTGDSIQATWPNMFAATANVTVTTRHGALLDIGVISDAAPIEEVEFREEMVNDAETREQEHIVEDEDEDDGSAIGQTVEIESENRRIYSENNHNQRFSLQSITGVEEDTDDEGEIPNNGGDWQYICAPTLSESQVLALPEVEYTEEKEGVSLQSLGSNYNSVLLEDDDDSESKSFCNGSCAICLEDFVQGERVRLLPRCRHVFHTEHILPWLVDIRGCCPLCKTPVLEEIESERAGEMPGRSDTDPLRESAYVTWRRRLRALTDLLVPDWDVPHRDLRDRDLPDRDLPDWLGRSNTVVSLSHYHHFWNLSIPARVMEDHVDRAEDVSLNESPSCVYLGRREWRRETTRRSQEQSRRQRREERRPRPVRRRHGFQRRM